MKFVMCYLRRMCGEARNGYFSWVVQAALQGCRREGSESGFAALLDVVGKDLEKVTAENKRYATEEVGIDGVFLE